MEMVRGMMPDQGLRVLSPHQSVQTVVDRSLQSLDLVEGLQKEVPLLKESADLRFDSPMDCRVRRFAECPPTA